MSAVGCLARGLLVVLMVMEVAGGCGVGAFLRWRLSVFSLGFPLSVALVLSAAVVVYRGEAFIRRVSDFDDSVGFHFRDDE